MVWRLICSKGLDASRADWCSWTNGYRLGRHERAALHGYESCPLCGAPVVAQPK
jgi:hypothetical protein